MLVCATEMTKRSHMDTFAEVFHGAVHGIGALSRVGQLYARGGESLMIRKVRQHVNPNEGLIFEQSSPGKLAYQLPELDVPQVSPAAALGALNVRSEIENFPEVSEVETIRHFTRLSTQNYAIDYGLYPLGSCTMKYNPRVNEAVARVDGLAWIHPYQTESLSQGALEIMAALELRSRKSRAWMRSLCSRRGRHGEFTGILLIRALLESQGNPRKKVLIPDSAHGTNPATVAMSGYAVENISSNDRGMIDLEVLAKGHHRRCRGADGDESEYDGCFRARHCGSRENPACKGAMLYMDGANMNALVGIARPGTLASM